MSSYYLLSYETLPRWLWHCTSSQRGPGQTITLPFQMSWETDVLGSCANSPLFPSAAPVPHPGDSGELHEHHLLRGKHHCWNNPLQTAILLPYGTPLSVCSAKTKTRSCDQRLKLFPQLHSLFRFCSFAVLPQQHTTHKKNNKETILLKGP